MGRYFDKVLFGKRLLEVMADNNDTTYSLAAFLHLSPPSISRYTNGEMAPKVPTIQAIADKYNINPAWLMGTEGANKYLEGMDKFKKIPIIGTIAAGKPIFAQEYIEGYEYVSEIEKSDFCLRVKGDSMVGARIYDGDIVFIRKQPDVESGEIAAVIINGDEATLKRVYKAGNSIILHAENPAYKDITIEKKDRTEVKIIGKAITFKSEVR